MVKFKKLELSAPLNKAASSTADRESSCNILAFELAQLIFHHQMIYLLER